MAKRFILIRDDHDAVNEPGVVAEGVAFDSGKVVINWTTRPHSIQTFDSLADLLLVQRKNTITRIQWVDTSMRDAAVPRPSGIHKLSDIRDRLNGLLGQGTVVVREEDHSVVVDTKD